MAEEAVVRIILQGEGGATPSASTASTASGTSPTPPSQPPKPSDYPPAVVEVVNQFIDMLKVNTDLYNSIYKGGTAPTSLTKEELATMNAFIAAMEKYPDLLAKIEKSTPESVLGPKGPPAYTQLGAESPVPSQLLGKDQKRFEQEGKAFFIAEERERKRQRDEEREREEEYVARLKEEAREYKLVGEREGKRHEIADLYDRAAAAEEAAELARYEREQAAIGEREDKRHELAELYDRAEAEEEARELARYEKEQQAIANREDKRHELMEIYDRAESTEEELRELARATANMAAEAVKNREEELEALALRAEHETVLAQAKKQIAAIPEVLPLDEALPAVDPTLEAMKRRNEELSKKEVEKEYKRIRAETLTDEERLDDEAKNLRKMRGAIGGKGGMLGSFIGSGLDIAAAGKDMKAASAAGATGAAAAVPVVGMVMAVKEIADKIKAEIIGGIKAAIGGVGGVFEAAAAPGADPSVPIGQLGDAATAASEKLVDMGLPIGYMTIALGETVSSLSRLMRSIDQTAGRYGEYNAGIAQAQAIAEIRHTMGDFRRAQEVSGEMAKYLMAQSDLQQKFEDIKVKMLAKILPSVTRAIEILEAIMPSGEGIANAIGVLTAPLEIIAEGISVIVGMEKENRLDDPRDPTEVLFREVPDRDAMKIPEL